MSRRERMAKAGDADGRAESRPRSDTHRALLEAIDRVCRTEGTASISAVAREVGVTPALIHNRYPDVAAAIRSLTGKHKRDEMAALKTARASERETLRLLRDENEILLAELRTLASVNEALRRELAILTQSGKVVSLAGCRSHRLDKAPPPSGPT